MTRIMRALTLAALSVSVGLAISVRPVGDSRSRRTGNSGRQSDCRTSLLGMSRCWQGRRPSPNAEAPPFAAIAETPGMTPIALTVALRTSHRDMPNIILSDEELRGVVAYIMSLQ